MRSAARAGEAQLSDSEEMNYAGTLNRALPDDIRVLGWAPVPDTFSARCTATLQAARQIAARMCPPNRHSTIVNTC